jgi:hypothetical protein
MHRSKIHLYSMTSSARANTFRSTNNREEERCPITSGSGVRLSGRGLRKPDENLVVASVLLLPRNSRSKQDLSPLSETVLAIFRAAIRA